MSNRGRHKKKKIIQKITHEDLTEHLKRIMNNSFYGVNNTHYYDFRPYFFMNDEQRKT